MKIYLVYRGQNLGFFKAMLFFRYEGAMGINVHSRCSYLAYNATISFHAF